MIYRFSNNLYLFGHSYLYDVVLLMQTLSIINDFQIESILSAGPALGVGKLGSRLGPPINKVRNYIFSYLFFIFLFHLGPPNSLRLGPRLGPPIP